MAHFGYALDMGRMLRHFRLVLLLKFCELFYWRLCYNWWHWGMLLRAVDRQLGGRGDLAGGSLRMMKQLLMEPRVHFVGYLLLTNGE